MIGHEVLDMKKFADELSHVDTDNDGKLSFDEFSKLGERELDRLGLEGL